MHLHWRRQPTGENGEVDPVFDVVHDRLALLGRATLTLRQTRGQAPSTETDSKRSAHEMDMSGETAAMNITIAVIISVGKLIHFREGDPYRANFL